MKHKQHGDKNKIIKTDVHNPWDLRAARMDTYPIAHEHDYYHVIHRQRDHTRPEMVMATDNNMTYSPDAVGTIDRHRYDYTNHMTDIDMIGRIFRSQFYGSKPAMDTARWITARRGMNGSLLNGQNNMKVMTMRVGIRRYKKAMNSTTIPGKDKER